MYRLTGAACCTGCGSRLGCRRCQCPCRYSYVIIHTYIHTCIHIYIYIRTGCSGTVSGACSCLRPTSRARLGARHGPPRNEMQGVDACLCGCWRVTRPNESACELRAVVRGVCRCFTAWACDPGSPESSKSCSGMARNLFTLTFTFTTWTTLHVHIHVRVFIVALVTEISLHHDKDGNSNRRMHTRLAIHTPIVNADTTLVGCRASRSSCGRHAEHSTRCCVACGDRNRRDPHGFPRHVHAQAMMQLSKYAWYLV